LNRHVRLPALDLAYVSAIEAGAIREHVLGPTLLKSKCSDRIPDVPLNILHLQQFRATLALSIQVITCGTIYGICRASKRQSIGDLLFGRRSFHS
jgi:hypothetical protein